MNTAEPASAQLTDEIAGLAFVADGSSLPAVLVIDGQRIVVVEEQHYLDQTGASRGKSAGGSLIEQDPAVADFLVTRFKHGVTIAALQTACVNKFGPERTPSRRKIGRFRLRLARCR